MVVQYVLFLLFSLICLSKLTRKATIQIKAMQCFAFCQLILSSSLLLSEENPQGARLRFEPGTYLLRQACELTNDLRLTLLFSISTGSTDFCQCFHKSIVFSTSLINITNVTIENKFTHTYYKNNFRRDGLWRDQARATSCSVGPGRV
jgi:hypothetical protein